MSYKNGDGLEISFLYGEESIRLEREIKIYLREKPKKKKKKTFSNQYLQYSKFFTFMSF